MSKVNCDRFATASAGKVEGDPKDFFQDNQNITKLTMATFGDYINEKTASLVLFCDPTNTNSFFSKREFKKVSKEAQISANRGIAAVNCTTDSDLCAREGFSSKPVFKMFTNGHYVSSITDYPSFYAREMENYIKNCPVLEDQTAGEVCLPPIKTQSAAPSKKPKKVQDDKKKPASLSSKSTLKAPKTATKKPGSGKKH